MGAESISKFMFVTILAGKERDAIAKDQMVRGKMSASVSRRMRSGTDRDGNPMNVMLACVVNENLFQAGLKSS